MKERYKTYWEKSILGQKERLYTETMWFPYPCLISFVLVLLFTGHTLLGLNPRVGNPSQVIPYKAPKEKEGSIWISVSINRGKVTVATADRKVFRWNPVLKNLSALAPFMEDLKQKMIDLTIATTLSKKISRNQSVVVLAVDQSLNYGHIKPIIFALAKSGISEYAFETRQPF